MNSPSVGHCDEPPGRQTCFNRTQPGPSRSKHRPNIVTTIVLESPQGKASHLLQTDLQRFRTHFPCPLGQIWSDVDSSHLGAKSRLGSVFVRNATSSTFIPCFMLAG
jgi:hypothetical protein